MADLGRNILRSSKQAVGTYAGGATGASLGAAIGFVFGGPLGAGIGATLGVLFGGAAGHGAATTMDDNSKKGKGR